MKKFFSPLPIFEEPGLALIRILTGLFMVYHGMELLDRAKMQEYASWAPTRGLPFPLLISYLGKSLELAGGLLLATGLWTRLGIALIILAMAYITFGIGNARIWYEDQYPFLFIVLGLVFFFRGPGIWSIDQSRFDKTIHTTAREKIK